jgi:hypothetical protein
MAIVFDRLQELLRAEGLAFFIDPAGSRVMFGGAGLTGTYHVGVALESEGRFLQFRSLQLLRCPPGHPHLAAVLETMARINCQYRFIKLGWDARDGEIVLFGDHWIADNEITHPQFHTLLGNFLGALDVQAFRLRKALETGVDPGEIRPEELLARFGEGLPQELRGLLDKLKKGGDQGVKGRKKPEEITEL